MYVYTLLYEPFLQVLAKYTYTTKKNTPGV